MVEVFSIVFEMVENEARQLFSNPFQRFAPNDYEAAGSYGHHGSHHGGGGGLGCCDDLIEYLALGIALFALMMTSMSRKRRKRSDESAGAYYYWPLQYLYAGIQSCCSLDIGYKAGFPMFY